MAPGEPKGSLWSTYWTNASPLGRIFAVIAAMVLMAAGYFTIVNSVAVIQHPGPKYDIKSGTTHTTGLCDPGGTTCEVQFTLYNYGEKPSAAYRWRRTVEVNGFVCYLLHPVDPGSTVHAESQQTGGLPVLELGQLDAGQEIVYSCFVDPINLGGSQIDVHLGVLPSP